MGLYEEGSWRTKTTDSVVCPKPRRLGLRLPFNHRVEMGDAGAVMEIIGIIHPKGGYVGEISSSYKVSSSPPFFSGSPPTRVSNPIIQDAYFVDEKRVTQPHPFAASAAAALALSLPTSSSGSEFKGGREGCVRSKFRNMQAEVRIEGFDCLKRDGRNCSISAMA